MSGSAKYDVAMKTFGLVNANDMSAVADGQRLFPLVFALRQLGVHCAICPWIASMNESARSSGTWDWFFIFTLADADFDRTTRHCSGSVAKSLLVSCTIVLTDDGLISCELVQPLCSSYFMLGMCRMQTDNVGFTWSRC